MLDKNGLLYKYQSGFYANFSTESCFVQLTDFIFGEMEKSVSHWDDPGWPAKSVLHVR